MKTGLIALLITTGIFVALAGFLALLIVLPIEAIQCLVLGMLIVAAFIITFKIIHEELSE